MARLVSRVALVVTISYAALIAVLLLATWHFAEPEAAAFDLLFIGFPWVLVCLTFHWLPYFSAVILNVATVYVFVFALDRALSRNSTSS
jgi:hypothetical protein